MFKKRSIVISTIKPSENTVNEQHDDRSIEEKAAAVLPIMNKVVCKVFAGVCIYVVLDTFRQVAIAEASKPN